MKTNSKILKKYLFGKKTKEMNQKNKKWVSMQIPFFFAWKNWESAHMGRKLEKIQKNNENEAKLQIPWFLH